MGMVLCLREASDDQLELLRSDQGAADEFLFDDAAFARDEIVDFDKAWNVLHLMLCGSDIESDHPLSLLINEPERLGSDNGYGGPWIIPAQRMAQFNIELLALTDEALMARFDPKQLAKSDAYLADSLAEEGPEALEYIMQSVPSLRALAQRCADNCSAAVAIIT